MQVQIACVQIACVQIASISSSLGITNIRPTTKLNEFRFDWNPRSETGGLDHYVSAFRPLISYLADSPNRLTE
jgi:hypothetical protein